MQKLLLAIAVMTAALAASATPGAAAERAYCLNGKATGGVADCSYTSMAQCLASVGGGADGCYPNPFYNGRAYEPGRGRKGARRHRRD